MRRCLNYDGGCVVIRLTADDYFKLYINGRFVTQGPAPAFDFRYYYVDADITDYLVPGENTAAFHTGYNAIGKFGYDTQFAECVDCTVPEVGFGKPDFDDLGWCNAAPSKSGYTFVKQPTEQLVFEDIAPVETRRTTDGLFIDFGRQYVGYPSFFATVKPGKESDFLLYDLDKWCVVNWPDEARDRYDFDLTEGRVAVGTHNVINAYYICAVKSLNKISEKLGLPAYRDEKPLVDKYLSAFFDSDAHLFRDAPESGHHALPSNAMVLAVGLFPDDETKENIISMIVSKPAECSAFFMTFASLVGLRREGREEEIVKLLRQYRTIRG